MFDEIQELTIELELFNKKRSRITWNDLEMKTCNLYQNFTGGNK